MASIWDSVSKPVEASEWDKVSRSVPDAQSDYTPTMKAAYDRAKDEHANDLENTWDGGWSENAIGAASFGTNHFINAAGNSLFKAPSRLWHGDSLVEGLRDDWAAERGKQAAVDESLSGVGKFTSGLMGGMAAAPAKGIQVAAAAAPAVAQTFKAALTTGAIQGSKWGGAGAFLDSDARPDTAYGLAQRLKAIPEGMADGAIAGATLAGGFNRLGAIRHWWSERAGNAPPVNAQRMQDFADTGTPQFGPAITDNPIARKTAQGLASSPFGGPLRDGAQAAVSHVEDAAQQALRSKTGGLPSNDLGAEIQGTLKNQVTKPSIPNRVIEGMPQTDLEAIAGPVTKDGFLPPKPVVDPVLPRPVDPVQAAVIPADLPQAPFQREIPRPQTITEQHVNVPSQLVVEKHNARILGEDLTRHLQESHDTLQAHQKALDDYRAQYHELDQLHQEQRNGPADPRQFATIDEFSDHQAARRAQHAQSLAALGYTPGHGRTFIAQRQALERNVSQANDVYASLSHKMSEHSAQIDKHGEYVKGEIARMQEAENQRAISYAEGINAQRSKVANDQHRLQLEANARSAADLETKRQRQTAQAEADAQTHAARTRAQTDYDAKITSGDVGFKTGRSRESYPTEFGAAYKLTEDAMPGRFPSNPLMGLDQVKGGKHIQSETARVINDLGIEANNALKIKGYKDGEPFTKAHLDTNKTVDGEVYGRIRPDLMGHLRQVLGPDVASRLEVLSEYRSNGRFVPKETIRELRTAIRRAASAAEKPIAPGETRTVSAAALRRLEGAITADLHTGLQSVGSKGETSSRMLRNVDQQYAAHFEDMRKPLAKLFGEKVEPIQAMERLADAAEDGNLKLIRAFMRVMTEKADGVKGAASIVSHMTGGARNLTDFVSGFGKIKPDVRDAMFSTPEGKAYRANLEKLERVGHAMEPYHKAIEGGGAVDLSKKTNLILIASAWSHFYGTLPVMAGAGAMSKFMASPRYVHWLTNVPPPRGPRGVYTSMQINQELGRLAGVASKDADLAKNVMSAALSMLTMPAHAAFAGEQSKTTDRGALQEAQALLQRGTEPAQVWKQTGWMQGADGRWRSEIDDSTAALAPDLDELGHKRGAVLGDVLQHPDLFKAYPDLARVPVRFAHGTGKYIGSYDPKLNLMMLSLDGENRKDLRETILHEIQHFIQKREGTEYGSRAKANVGSFADYLRQPGEDEAWQAAGRRDLTSAQRRSAYPYDEQQRRRATEAVGIPHVPQRELQRPAGRI